MKTGDIVCFKYPDSVKEAELQFIVIEMRGDRVLVQELPNFHIVPPAIYPTFVYLQSDLESVTPKNQDF